MLYYQKIRDEGDRMKLIIGLGNPGDRYDGSRHNMGYDVVDAILERNQLEMTDQKFRADYTIWHHPQGKVMLMKPFTYMNLSGEALLPLMAYYGIDLDDVLVVADDLDLDVGRMRFRLKGSSGGQRGLQNIIDLLGTNEFKRLKIGIGRPEGGWKVSDYVLAPFKKGDREVIDDMIFRSAQGIEQWLEGATFDQVMQDYNINK